ncbi:leucyl aminopeptidase [Candidatus Woesearchaeota archaeon]|nr:leucyl aminopeptidase [Candidatus Woesearchaeota archaeon]
MKINLEIGKPHAFKSDLIVIGLFEKEAPDKHLDDALDKEISNLIKSEEFKGEEGQVQIITTLGKIHAKKILLIGLGKKKEFNLEKLRRAAAHSAKHVRNLGIKIFSTTLQSVLLDRITLDKAKAVVEGTLLGLYQFNQFKTVDKDKIKEIQEMIILDNSEKNRRAIDEAVKTSTIICEATNYTKDIVNMPASIANPNYLANEAKKMAKQFKLKIKVFSKRDLEKMGMNCILAVGQGSEEEPKLVVLEYNSSKKGGIAFVGKGVCFDSGGLDIKPASYMADMKSDDAGAAAVLGLIKAAAQLKIPRKIIAVIPLVENMTGGKAYKPGDIITAYNKKTVEVAHTDAEGRLILADALAYAETMKPDLIIDIATLTGSCVAALGYWATGMLTKDEKYAPKIIEAGEETYERVWQLPLWDEYKDLVKSRIADIKNSHLDYDAGCIEGAMFLLNFVENTPFIHLDIAGTGWFKEDKGYITKGGTGVGVRLLMEFLKKFY